MISVDDLRPIAAEVHDQRPDWDTQGILAALWGQRDRGDLEQLRAAALHTAADPATRTPGAIRFDHHWRTRPTTDHRSDPPRPCPVCRRTHNPDEPDRHVYRADPDTTARGAAAARAALRARRDTEGADQ